MSDDKVQILFKPQAGKLKQIYPELKENKKFNDILSDEFLFVWYFACASSPIDPELPDMMRAKTAAAEAIKDFDKRKKFANLEFPEKIKEAIDEMKKYNPDVRMVAKRIIQTTFNNLEKMTQINEDSFIKIDKDGVKTTDWAGRKQYVDSVSKISETLPSLIAQMEHGFGYLDSKSDKESGKKSIDKFHENNND